MISKKSKFKSSEDSSSVHAATYSTRYFTESVPRDSVPERGMPADAAYQLVHDEMNLDGNPALNLATFVTTWMEPEAANLVTENIHKNFIDHDEYPQTAVIEERVVKMLARLFNAPAAESFTGTRTIGSSEAIMLGLLAHKWNWKKRMQSEGKPYDRPNMVMGADVHVVWEKFARYFDVEPRIVPMAKDSYTLEVDEVAGRLDENTICVGAVVGTTFTGQIDPVKEINDLLVETKDKKGWDIPLHVDGASGAFIVPFVYPDLEWDFRLSQVKAINASGHKYGLVYPGVGWLIFRDESALPEDLIFKCNYLGGEMPTYTLNFSQGSSMVLAQYYNLIRLGKEGYGRIMQSVMENAEYLGKRLVDTAKLELLNPQQRLPILAVKLKEPNGFTVFDLSDKLRERGWIVPAYTLPPNAENTAVLRIVVKENFSRDMAEWLFTDLMDSFKSLEAVEMKARAGLAATPGGHPIC